jgi:prevent-host-death family protein
MAATVNIHEAKTHLSRLLVRVAGGEEIIIAKSGMPVARLVSAAPPKIRTPGRFRGQISGVESLLDPAQPEDSSLWVTGPPTDPLAKPAPVRR